MDKNVKNAPKIIVSFTSYPARMFCVNTMLESIFAQTKKADKIILYLCEREFPNRLKDVPNNVKQLIGTGDFEIRWCKDNLKPHNKYFYAFQDFPNELVVTVDDDIQYPPQLIEVLYDSYVRHPDCVSAWRIHTVAFSESGEFLPYRYWTYEDNTHIDVPSHQLLATGVGGVLYPVSLFLDKTMLNHSAIQEVCPLADDLWLYAMELVNSIPVVHVGTYDLQTIPCSQSFGLYKTNNFGENQQNDVYLRNIANYILKIYGKTLQSKIVPTQNDAWNSREYLYDKINTLNNAVIRPLKKKNILLENEIASMKSNNVAKRLGIKGHLKKLLKKNANKYLFYPANTRVAFYLPYYKKDHIQKIIHTTENYYEKNVLDDVLVLFRDGIIGKTIKDTVVLDIGANIGNHTLYFLSECNAAKVYCFEPVQDTFSILKKNILINHFDKRTVLYNCGVGAESGKAVIKSYNRQNIGSTEIALNANGGISIVAIDDLHIQEPIGFIKIDTEGFEKNIIEGMRATIQKNLPYMFIEIRPENYNYIYTLLTDYGYTFIELSKNDEYTLCLCFIYVCKKIMLDAPVHFFGTDNKSSYITLSGLSKSEECFTWSNDKKVHFRFAVEGYDAEKAIHARFDFTAVFTGKQDVSVSVNGVEVQNTQISDGMPLEFDFDMQKDGTIDMIFSLPNASSPKELGISEDSRMLALAFSSMKLTQK